MIELIDSHAHYDDPAFDDDRDELLKKLFQESCRAIVNIGCDPATFSKTAELAEKYERVFVAFGVHPEFADDIKNDYIESVEKYSRMRKAVAIGEIGLDYHYGGNREKQIEVFEQQLILAEKLDMPVIIHSRDAVRDTLDILKKHRPKGVVHCFTGSPETAQEILSLGMSIGFTGAVTFKNAKKVVQSCAVVPVDRMLLETDCPYMTPEPYRGRRCDSSFIRFTSERIAEIKGMTPEAIIKQCAENTIKLFGLAKFPEIC